MTLCKFSKNACLGAECAKKATDKSVPEFELLFVDETTLSLHPPLRRCWMKRGVRKLIPDPGVSKQLHVFGAYNWRSAQVTYTVAQRKNSDTFVEFLEAVVTQYPTESVILVMDNASYHHSKISRAALSLFEDRIRAVWLPPYSPFLNLIERFWLHVKKLAVANRMHTSLDDLEVTLHQVMTHQNTDGHLNQLRLVG